MRLSKQFLATIFFLMISTQSYYSQVFDWVTGISGEGVYGQAIATDEEGNSYVTGYFLGTANFGTTILTSSGSDDIFIAKYDNSGNCLWAQKAGAFGTVNGDIGTGIAVDTSGNSYITGHFEGTATFGTITLSSSGRDIFIAKYDAFGNCLWAQNAGGTSEDRANGIWVDEIGNSYITGYFNGLANFGLTTLTEGGSFIAKYDNAGSCLWAKKSGGTSGNGISVEASGGIYITGYFSGTTTFGTTTLTSSGSSDIFIAKYDNIGDCLWVKKAGGTSEDTGFGISVDTSGNSYIIGDFLGTATFGMITLIGSGRDVFIAKYDVAGNCLWVKKAGGASEDLGRGVTVDALGNSYITGEFEGTATFGTTTLVSSGMEDIFIAKYDNDGNCLWAQKAGATYYDYGKGISILEKDIVNVTGNIGGYAIFGNTIINNRGGFNARIMSTLLSITSPYGGEIWQTNTQHNITWNSVDDGNIKIEITTDNGANWIILQNSVVASLGNYTLTVPPFSTSSECKVRLTSLSYGTVSISNAFTITSENAPNITLTSPNTFLKWKAGSSQNITWDFLGTIDSVDLEYTTDNGENWNTIANSTAAITKSYIWVVPNAFSTKCRIRISNSTNLAMNDVSDLTFTIYDIKVTSPSAGDNWRASTSKIIKWMSACINSVNLYYSTNSGANWILIASNIVADNGCYTWSVPNISSSECKIKIEDLSDLSIFNISNVFSIWQPIVSMKTPLTGQSTQNFDLTNINFSAYIIISDAITVTYYFYESPIVGSMPEGIVGVGQYYWLISSPSISFINGIIRVPLATLGGVIDSAKLVWLKRTNSGDTWVNIGGEIQGEYLVSTIAFDSFSEFTIGTTSDENPLPIELNSFNALVTNDMEVTLSWKTATEVNNSGFTIEKKLITTNLWQNIGFVPGSGTTNKPISYSFNDKININGIYLYRLKQIDFNGKFSYSKEVKVEVTSLPQEFALYQNYPNPFNPVTKIKYSIPVEGLVNIAVFNMLGEKVIQLVNTNTKAGNYEIDFNGSTLSSGIYFYRIESGNFINVKKMIIMK